MAEDTPGFNPLENLGEGYGSLNQIPLDTKDFLPFEGNTTPPPSIDFPDRGPKYYPVMPAADTLDNQVARNKAGVANSLKRTPGVNQTKKAGSLKNILDAFGDAAVQRTQANADPNEYARMYSYNAGPAGSSFYKRYAAYGQETFDKLGFHPLRDNEAIYNAGTTKMQEATKMLQHSFWPLFKTGFMSAPKSLGKMLSGDFSADVEDATAYEEAAAIGQSTRGGVFGFVNNTAMNFGYTAGIISEAVAEEILGAALAAPTLGASLYATTANNVRKAVKGADLFADGMKAVRGTLNSLNDVNQSRKFWESSKIFFQSKVGKFINPLENLTEASIALQKADNLTNLARASKTVGAFYRDVRNLNMALSEGRLEAGMVQNHVYDKLYDDYYAKHNEAPSDQLQQDMMNQAKEASANTLFWNTGLIYLSNKITFDNITGPKGGLRNMLKTTTDDIMNVSGGKFGDFGKIIYDKAAKKFQFEKANFKNYIKNIPKDPLRKTALKTVGYLKANLSEGIQENLQEVIAGVNERYYVDNFKSKARRSHEYAKGVSTLASRGDLFQEELGKQFSKQGLETFASGFLMGTFAAPVNSGFQLLGVGYNRMFNKEEYQKYKDAKTKISEGIVNTLNDVNMDDFFKSKVFNLGVQDIISDEQATADKKQGLDGESEAFIKQVSTMLQSDTLDMFTDTLKGYKDLSPEEFENALPNVPKGEGAKYQAKIDTILDNAERIQKRYKFYTEKYPNPVNLEDYKDKDSPEFEDAASLYHAWNEAVHNGIFFSASFENTMERMAAIAERLGTNGPLAKATQRDMDVLLREDVLKNEIGLLKTEIETMSGSDDPSVTADIEKKKKKLKALEDFKESYQNHDKYFNRSKYKEYVRQKLQEQRGEGAEVTDEEVDKALNQIVSERTDDNDIAFTSKLEKSYKAYLRTIAETNDDFIFDDKVDEAFELLTDHYKLNAESQNLAKYINVLHNPANFLDLVERNRKWMKDLYNNRRSYYTDMVNQEISNIEGNALLNELAKQGIYVSVDDFVSWRDEGVPPSEFFDEPRNLVYREGSPKYDEYYAFFEAAAELSRLREKFSAEKFDQELQDQLDALDAKMNEEIDKLDKISSKVPKGEIKPTLGKKVSISKVARQLENNTYVDLTYEEGDTQMTMTLYKDSKGILKYDDENGEEVDTNAIKTKFLKAETYKMVEKPNQDEINAIRERYQELKNQKIEDYAKMKAEQQSREDEFMDKRTEEEPAEPIEPTDKNQTRISEIEDKILNIKSRLEGTYYFIGSTDSAAGKEAAEKTAKQFEEELKSLTEELAQLKSATTTATPKSTDGEFEFNYEGKVKNTRDLTVDQLNTYKNRFKKKYFDLSKLKDELTVDQKAELAIYKLRIAEIDNLLSIRAKANVPADRVESINKINKLVAEQQDITEVDNGFIIDDAFYARPGLVKESKFDKYLKEQVKNLFEADKAPVLDPKLITEPAYESIFGPDGIMSMIKKKIDSGELYLAATDLIVYDSTNNVANVVDMVVLDAKGKYTLINLASMNQIQWDKFNTPESEKKNYQLDAAYSERMFNNLIGQGANIALLPVQIVKDLDTGEVLIATRPTNQALFKLNNKQLLIGLSKDSVKKEVDEYLPQKAFNVGATINPETRQFLNILGYKNSQIDAMSKEEREYILTEGIEPQDFYIDTQDLHDDLNRMNSEIDQIIQERLDKYALGVFDLFNNITRNIEITTDRAYMGIPVDPTALASAIDYYYEVYNEITRLKNPNTKTERIEKSLTINYLLQVQEELKNTLDYLIEYENSLKSGKSVPTFEYASEVSDTDVTEGTAEEGARTDSTEAQEKPLTPEELKINGEYVQKGTNLIAKKTIFTGKKQQQKNIFANENDTVIVREIDKVNKTVTLSVLGKKKKMTVSFDELSKMFILKQAVMDMNEVPSEEMTQDDKAKVAESIDLAAAFLNDPTRIADVESAASTKSVEDLDDELLNDIEC